MHAQTGGKQAKLNRTQIRMIMIAINITTIIRAQKIWLLDCPE
jgi:hypothetical protein